MQPVPNPRRGSITAAAAGFTAFVNIYALQSLLPLLAEAFEASSRQASLAVSATTLAVALAAPAAGWLVGRTTRGTLVKLSVGGLVIAGLNVAAAPTLNVLIFWRFVQGLFLPLLVAGVLAFIAQDFPREQLSRATSNYVTWTIVGGFAGRWMGGFAAGSWGWRPALVFLALANAASGLILLASLSRPQERVESKTPPRLLDFLHSLADRRLRSAYLIGFSSLFTLVGLFTYITFRLAEGPFHLGPEGLGRVFCVYLLGIAVTPMVGRALGRIGVSTTVKTASTAAIIGLWLTMASNLVMVLAGLSLVCVAAFATQAAVSSFIANLAPKGKAVAAGLYLSCYYFGGCLGAVVPGFAWEQAGWLGCVLVLTTVQVALRHCSKALPE